MNNKSLQRRSGISCLRWPVLKSRLCGFAAQKYFPKSQLKNLPLRSALGFSMDKIIILLLTFSVRAIAEDSVSISTRDNFSPGASLGQSIIAINRTESKFKGNPSLKPIDLYFNHVEEIVSREYVREGWSYSFPEASVIVIEVVIFGKKVILSSSHSLLEDRKTNIALESGIKSLNGRDPKVLLSQQSKSFQAKKLAFNELLEITMSKLKYDFKN